MSPLRPRQEQTLKSWLPAFEIRRNHSWGLVDTTVLEICSNSNETYTVKGFGPEDHHYERERDAYLQWTEVLGDRTPTLVLFDDAARLLVLTHLPGVLADRIAALEPWMHEQAGELLQRFHAQSSVRDAGEFEEKIASRIVQALQAPHRIDSEAATFAREVAEHHDAQPTVLVPTHGDYQPRNWIIYDQQVGVIDYGRAELRPAFTDLNLFDFKGTKACEDLQEAFIEGYGSDLRHERGRFLYRVHQAVTTAVWAHKVGDEAFEREGLALLGELRKEAEILDSGDW